VCEVSIDHAHMLPSTHCGAHGGTCSRHTPITPTSGAQPPRTERRASGERHPHKALALLHDLQAARVCGGGGTDAGALPSWATGALSADATPECPLNGSAREPSGGAAGMQPRKRCTFTCSSKSPSPRG